MPREITQERRALLDEVRARRWNGAQLEAALERCGWPDAALARIRGIGGRSNQVTRWTKTVKRWLRDKLDIDPVQQEWLERVLAAVEAGPFLLEGPPGPMNAARLREIARRLEWEPLVQGEWRTEWDEAGRGIEIFEESRGRDNDFALFSEVFQIPQERARAMALGEESIPARLGDALEGIMDGVREQGREEDGGGGGDEGGG